MQMGFSREDSVAALQKARARARASVRVRARVWVSGRGGLGRSTAEG